VRTTVYLATRVNTKEDADVAELLAVGVIVSIEVAPL